MSTNRPEGARPCRGKLTRQIADIAAVFDARYRFRLAAKARVEFLPHGTQHIQWMRITPAGWKFYALRVAVQTGHKVGPRRLRQLMEYAAVLRTPPRPARPFSVSNPL